MVVRFGEICIARARFDLGSTRSGDRENIEIKQIKAPLCSEDTLKATALAQTQKLQFASIFFEL